jgi:RNA-binding protein
MDSINKKKLRTQAHSLNPVVIVGQAGLTEAVLAESEVALNHHELIKIKIRAERDERKRIAEQICRESGACLIQEIGQIAVLYRKKLNVPAKPKKPVFKRNSPK